MDRGDDPQLTLDDAPDAAARPLGPWNPGVTSYIPRRLLPLATLFRPENSFTDVAEASEISAFTGLEPGEVVRFRPQRLLLQELLVRITADLSVPDGSEYRDLGINFRAMVDTILDKYVGPNLPQYLAAYDALQPILTAMIDEELKTAFAVGQSVEPDSRRSWFGMRRPDPPARPAAVADRLSLAEAWERRAHGSEGARRAVCAALAKVLRALYGKHGHAWGSAEMIAGVALVLAWNEHGGEMLGRLVEADLLRAVAGEGYALLPSQPQPMVMNTKGAPASGKSTLRPLQRALAGQVGVRWNEFALISPDIWRKQLLDSASLGADHRYGAMLTGEELAIVDQKLDRYMARKAEQGRMSHLLIDRFRFGGLGDDHEKTGSRLLTRFGRTIHLFFMITPPEALVERAWTRGLEFGRYKAVDDLLAHSVEAYTAMPNLLLTWAERNDREVHYELLDNSVRLGETPRTVAFGCNGQMFILRVGPMLDIERFRRISIVAAGPQDLYPDAAAADPAENTAFLLSCARGLRQVSFADAASGRIYLRLRSGVPEWVDAAAFAAAVADPDTAAGLRAVAPAAFGGTLDDGSGPSQIWDVISPDSIRTLGSWGDDRRTQLGAGASSTLPTDTVTPWAPLHPVRC
jgi:hypothetical protein